MECKILIGGEAGQGIQTVSNILSKYFFRIGYYVFTVESYQSRIRGGHNYSLLRISDRPIYAIDDDKIDILIALNLETIKLHIPEVKREGYILCDENINTEDFPKEDRIIKIPVRRITQELKSRLVENTIFCGALLALSRGDMEEMKRVISEGFKEEYFEINLRALEEGYKHTLNLGKSCGKFPKRNRGKRLLVNGAEAVGFGAIVAGCKFLASYPMTPGTAVMNFIAEHELDFDIVVEQAEDEIAAINMAIGAFFAGARSMVTTSGGGFALMVEGLSLSGMTETPVVIHIGQRPGPATGLPTRTEQGDLNFVVHAGHGEFARYITAPRDQKDAFYKTIKAFELAEKYQIPSIILTDQYLIDSKAVIEGLIPPSEIKSYRTKGNDDYLRHRITEDGVSPFAIPGESEALVITDSDEHDEEGHITEDLEIRKKMVEKRMKKKELLLKEIEEPLFFGVDNPEFVFIGWGSTYGVIREGIERLINEGYPIGHLHFSDVYPIAKESLEKFKGRKLYTIEQNYQGQFAALLRKETGINVERGVVKYNGFPFYVEEIIKGVKEIMG
ncbi:MAG: 2-oxoacid:acceptor oxidoreductase subunit alpha [Dictyoglomus sp.]|uniref:2-oxoacid:acceptor oxidoreductase subunit alpha n=1 Tax=Dictyoglomus sp. TaxID=28205 RepID=UPI003D0B8CF1